MTSVFYLLSTLLVIKIRQSAREKSFGYCKNSYLILDIVHILQTIFSIPIVQFPHMTLILGSLNDSVYPGQTKALRLTNELSSAACKHSPAEIITFPNRKTVHQIPRLIETISMFIGVFEGSLHRSVPKQQRNK